MTDDDTPQESIRAVKYRENYLTAVSEFAEANSNAHKLLMAQKAAMVVAKQKQLQMFDARQEMYVWAFKDGVVTRSLVDVFAPVHLARDCDDENLVRGDGRCARCTLLQAIEKPYSLDCDISIELKVTVDRRVDER